MRRYLIELEVKGKVLVVVYAANVQDAVKFATKGTVKPEEIANSKLVPVKVKRINKKVITC